MNSVEVLIPLFGMFFSLGVPLAVVLVYISLNYRKRRRLLELHHAERMAAIERGMDVPPLPVELFEGRAPKRRRTSLLPGLIWFFLGLAILLGMMFGDDHDMPWMIGLIPLAIGAAYLVYYFTEGRAIEARQLEHDLASPRGEQRLASPTSSPL